MDIPSNELVDLFYKLLPGFLAATVFYSFTPYPRRDALDRIVTALIFTLFAQLAVAVIHLLLTTFGKIIFTLGEWTTSVELGWGAVSGLAIGVGWSHFVNNGLPHRLFRRYRTTKKTSIPNAWFGAFNKYDRYIVLNLKDGRRLMGWPKQWPDEPDSGHFLLEEPTWLEEDGTEILVRQIEVMLFPVELVEQVDFLRFRDDPATSVDSTKTEPDST